MADHSTIQRLPYSTGNALIEYNCSSEFITPFRTINPELEQSCTHSNYHIYQEIDHLSTDLKYILIGRLNFVMAASHRDNNG